MNESKNVVITYKSQDGVELHKMGEQIGQLALLPAHHFARWVGKWHPIGDGIWDIMHVRSGLRIDTVQCTREEAVKVCEALRRLDFDQFYLDYTSQGEIDAQFVEAYQYEMMAIDAYGEL